MVPAIKTFTIGLYLVSSLNCPPTKVENRTPTWTKHDHKMLKFNQKRCKQKYKNSPCLIFFRKVRKQTYHALCGAEDE